MTVRVASTCTACGACLVTCPTGALSVAPHRPAVDGRACIDCLACVEVCPVDAVSLAAPAAPSAARMCL